MHIDFDPLKVEWSAFATAATSHPEGLLQHGGYNVFRGVPYQRGNGVGSVFRSLMRYLIPIGKEIGTAVGRQGLESGNRVLSSVLEGKDLKESLVAEGKAGLKNLLEKAAGNIKAQKGSGGGGGEFDFKRYNKNASSTEQAAREVVGLTKMKKSINKLQSTLGPQNFLPTSKKVSNNNNKYKKKKKQRKRKDILGSY